MEKNTLKLKIKKNIFEDVVNNPISHLMFETTSFYFSKFTTNKNNTIEDIKNDNSLIKTFDSVIFDCGSENVEYDNVNIRLITDLNENEEIKFCLEFHNPNCDKKDDSVDEVSVEQSEVETVTETETVEHVEEVGDEHVETPIVENESESEVETEVEHVSEEQTEENTEVEDTTMVGTPGVLSGVYTEEILTKFENHPRVYSVNKSIVRVTYMGKIYGCDKKLPCKNEHDYTVSLGKVSIPYVNGDDLYEKLLEFTKKGYVLVNFRDSDFDFSNSVYNVCLKVISKSTLIDWM